LQKGITTARTAAAITVQVTEVYSFEQVKLEAGLAGLFNAVEVSGFDFHSTEKRSLFLKIVQRYYTVDLRPYPAGIDYLGHAVTCQDVLRQLAHGDVPVIVTEVDYGRILIYQMSSTKDVSATKLESAFRAKVLKQGTLTAELNTIFESSEKRLLVLGGSPEVVAKVISSENAVAFFEDGLRWSADSPGVPLIYRMNYMSPGLPPFKYGDTTDFEIRECTINGGDNLWTTWMFGLDHGHDNNYRLERDGSPVCGRGLPGVPGSCWGNRQKVGGSYGPGSLSVGHGKDFHMYGVTYLHVRDNTNLQANISGDVVRFWVNDNELMGNPIFLSLKAGCNKLEFTSYNQNQSTGVELRLPLANYVLRQDSESCQP